MVIDNVIDSIISPKTTGQPIQQEIKAASVVLGYSGGNSWPTFQPYQQARPDLDREDRVIPVTLSCTAFGHMYDIEPGGGKNGNIGVFMHNARMVWKTQNRWGPQWLYTFASNVAAMVEAARGFGFEQGRDYYVLAAHPNSRFGRHICSPDVCGFPKADGTQYLFQKTYDESIINDYMIRGLGPGPAPSPQPQTQEENSLITSAISQNGTFHVFELKDGWIWFTYQQPNSSAWTGGQQGVSIAAMQRLAPAPDVVSIDADTSRDGTMHVFGRKSDGSIVYTFQKGGSSSWNGGEVGKSVAALTPFAPA